MATMLGTVKKLGQLLDLFDVRHPEWSVTELAATLNLPKSSVHDHLSSLSDIGLLQRTPAGRYRLGWRLLALSGTLLLTTDLRIEGKPVLEKLAARVGESVNLVTLVNGKLVGICAAGPPKPLSTHDEVGMVRPAHCTSAGKMLLAYEPWHQVETIIERQNGLKRHTPNTITDVATLRRELERVRQLGFSYDFEEITPGVCCVAAPVRDDSGRVLAAVRLAAAKSKFMSFQQLYCSLVVEAAGTISRRLGYLAPKPSRWAVQHGV
jgi:IclR family transcriptional regulator, KDG regulon repressor